MSLALVQPARRLKSWITSFEEYTENLQSPPILRRWAAISLIAAALEQRVWVRTMGMSLYPNLYVGIVGPPGGGKTLPIIVARQFFGALEEHFLAPSSVTCAGLSDVLNESKRRIVRPNGYSEFNSLYIASRELGVLLPGYDTEYMSTLNDLYDCGLYSQRRRGGGIAFEIPNAQINILAATTPSYLNSFLPEGAWAQGFTSRTIFVYSGATSPKDFFDESTGNGDLQRSLVVDLQVIGSLYGKIEFEREAVEVIRNWHMAGGEPIPEHPKLVSYNSRRSEHILKLCQIACVARGNTNLWITVEDFQTALNWLVEAEGFMPDIFRSMYKGGDSAVTEEAYYFVWKFGATDPIPEARLFAFVHERTPSHNVTKLIEMMVKGGLIVKDLTAVGTVYKPGVKR